MAETMSRLAACEKENSELRARNEWLENQLAVWDPIHAIRRALPTDEEAAKLLRVVCGRFPHMREQNTSEHGQVQNFLCSLAFVMSLTMTKESNSKHSGGWWIDQATAWCSTARMPGRPRTLLPSIICLDIPYMLDHSSISLDPFRSRGTQVDSGAWRRILAVGDLKPAIPVNKNLDHSIGFRKVLAPTW
jgi:hypothetical protein